MTLWTISDTHFGHANMLTFKREDGITPVRQFENVEEMDEVMVDNWNRIVKPQDHVYHLGDVCMNPKHLDICFRLNGHKRLILGNHDHWDMRKYQPYFEKIFASRVFDGMIMTHIPVHVDSLGRFGANVHGHVHLNSLPDPRYVNACVEVRRFAPVALEDIKKEVRLANAQLLEAA